MYCCDLFRYLIGNAGKPGLSVIPRSVSGLSYFCLQTRAVKEEDMNLLQNKLLELSLDTISGENRLNLVTQQGIGFCPFCGTDLEKWIEKNRKVFEKDAQALKHLLE